MPMIPAEKLAEWQRICEAATPGPWYTEPTGETYGGYAVESVVAATYYGPPLRVYAKSLGGTLPWADRGFIAAARNAMPELLTAYEEAAALLGQYHQALHAAWVFADDAARNEYEFAKHRDAMKAALSFDGATPAQRLAALEELERHVIAWHTARAMTTDAQSFAVMAQTRDFFDALAAWREQEKVYFDACDAADEEEKALHQYAIAALEKGEHA